MRGALEPIEGVSDIDVIQGRKAVWVAYEPQKTEPAELLAALDSAGEPATIVPP